MRGGNVSELELRMRQGLQLHQNGRHAEAESFYRQVLEAKPKFAPAQHFLGLLLHQTERSEEGLQLLNKSIIAEPRNSDFLNNTGSALRSLGRLEASADCFKRALAARADNNAARENLALVQLQLGRLESAETAFRGVLSRSPVNARAHINLSETMLEQGRVDDALEVLKSAMQIMPQNADVVFAFAQALTEKGDLTDAVAICRKVLEINPLSAKAWLLLSQLKRFKDNDPDIALMDSLFQRTSTGSDQRMLMCFALGKAQEDLKDYDKAFACFQEGNAIQRKVNVYDREKTAADFDRLKAAFNAQLVSVKQNSDLTDDTPIFIVGMPRSGTTLLEQILASHPNVYGAGELGVLRNCVSDLFLRSSTSFPDDIASTNQKALKQAGQSYLDQIKARYRGHPHVTDKMPGNFMLVGLIHLMMPHAKIIHCVREPVATCLSIYKTLFRNGHSYGYDLDELAEFHNLYSDLMEHWHKVLPGRIFDLNYEQLVADQVTQTRALLNHCGLEWDNACLDFAAAARPVRTASAAQIRQPIQSASLELWKHYGAHLKPLIEQLHDRNTPRLHLPRPFPMA